MMALVFLALGLLHPLTLWRSTTKGTSTMGTTTTTRSGRRMTGTSVMNVQVLEPVARMAVKSILFLIL
jgi:hypothetical protein